jgi:TnpA family transposase
MWELKSGDLAVIGSDHFADYRDQLVTWDEYTEKIDRYGELAGVPVTGPEFVAHVEAWLSDVAESTDRAFPSNQAVSIEDGVPSIHRPEKRPDPEGLRGFEELVASRLDPVNILDILTDTEYWLHWTQFFGPISGHETKVEDPVARHLTAVFCYGCHLGPTQTARSLGGVGRRSVAWVNLRHVTEEKLDRAIAMIINAYNRFALPKYWGTGKSASADGTKWNLYEQNLLSEYHIRYGGYGGIGYYHVSDNYVALFSRFIPCGVWEGVYILDGLIENESDIRPDTVHSDTQGQSAPIFGLAYLLGIQLMPRIRNWKKLDFRRPNRTGAYEHIDGLFSGTVDWELIRTHLPDMLRVALSIKEGRITASTILRKLGTYSRKNRLYLAFRELGVAVRTGFLLKYLADEELRSTIQAATNKSESFNGFTKWLAFGSDATVAANNRDEQRKIIKYNHLVANCVIFYNVSVLTRLLGKLQTEGHSIHESAVAAISPYLTQHIHRFGSYNLNLDREPPPVDYDAAVITVADRTDPTEPIRPIEQLPLWVPDSSTDGGAVE